MNILKTAAFEAGKIALSYHRQDPEFWEKDQEQGPVSEADLAVNQYLMNYFAEHLPEYAILSEEIEDDLARLNADKLIVIDPIDGTKAYLKGEEHFAVAIALFKQNDVTHAVIYAPAKNDMYWAMRGGGAYRNDEPIHVSDQDELSDARVLASRAKYNRGLIDALDLQTHFRPSIALRLAYVAEGSFDLTLALRPSWDWDIMAGDLIVREAGGKVIDADGNTPLYNRKNPQQNGIIAGNIKLVEMLFNQKEAQIR